MAQDGSIQGVAGGLLIGIGFDSIIGGVISDAIINISPLLGIAVLAIGVFVAFVMRSDG